jgi:hypothetical protein
MRRHEKCRLRPHTSCSLCFSTQAAPLLGRAQTIEIAHKDASWVGSRSVPIGTPPSLAFSLLHQSARRGFAGSLLGAETHSAFTTNSSSAFTTMKAGLSIRSCAFKIASMMLRRQSRVACRSANSQGYRRKLSHSSILQHAIFDSAPNATDRSPHHDRSLSAKCFGVRVIDGGVS